MASSLADALNQELKLSKRGIQAVLDLLAEGATVPFIARYRKERTGALDEVQIRAIEDRASYRRALDDRRLTILRSLDQQGKLTDELREKIQNCATRVELEDIYLPYRPKRRSKGAQAKARGLAPLAGQILAQLPDGDPELEASHYVSAEKDVPNPDEALSGARDIIIEMVAERPELRTEVRRLFAESGILHAEATAAIKNKGAKHRKFESYYNFSEAVKKVPPHRVLAIRRGQAEKILKVRIAIDTEPVVQLARRIFAYNASSPFSGQLATAIQEGVVRKLTPGIENDVWTELKAQADAEAVDIFASNLENLLLAAPLGPKTVIGIDPGIRTGNKCAVIDATGKFLETVTLFTSQAEEAQSQAQRDLLALIQKYQPDAIAIGNGTGGREIEQLVRQWLREAKIEATVVPVSEAGASVYSASEIARAEFPDLDISVRGAISIGRRLQDPLAELVKIEPKAIGVGQYQHDVHPALLQKRLHAVVESCVNQVGVELATASMSLLSYVAGIGVKMAQAIVIHRHQNGSFRRREELLNVVGLGPKTFEQAAGFVRIRDSSHPLDRSAVHPERYDLVARMAEDAGVTLETLVGNAEAVDSLVPENYVDNSVGELTLKDIISELKKPGRDPRRSFEPPKFLDGINTLEDLKKGMVIEGVVTNVTAFGAFVDVGVHQDGLVHISELSGRFVRDPALVTRVGEKLKVRVLDVDIERKRISLSAKPESPAADTPKTRREDRKPRRRNQEGPKAQVHPGKRRAKGTPKNAGGKRRDPNPSEGKRRRPKSGFSNNPFAELLKDR